MIINYISYSKGQDLIKQLQTRVIETVLATLNIETDIEVNLLCLGRFKMRQLNKKMRHIARVTDVLSFPNLPLLPAQSSKLGVLITKQNYPLEVSVATGNLFLGDIAFCMPVIIKQARKFGNTFEREMAYMTVHGMLHLLGFDHSCDADKQVMRAVEERVLEKMQIIR